ncbi:MAG: hypothetical protein IPJ65_20810 [Archangiaceae bacterium]|nr:hypothetical protein [Archangiaceae bacterium]
MNLSHLLICTALATCGDHIIVGDLPDGGSPESDGGVTCGGCWSGGQCVTSTTTNACGTGAGSCSDCSVTVQHASLPSCTAGACAFVACETGWSDCDGDPTNGCERNVSACFEVIATGQDQPRAVATDGVDVYWVIRGGTLRRVPKGGGTVTDLATDVSLFLLRDSSIYFVKSATTLAVIPKAAGTPAVLTTTAREPQALTADSTSLFWWDETGDGKFEIRSAPLSGGPETLLAGGLQRRVDSLTPVGSELWFMQERELFKLPKAGGQLARLATLPVEPLMPNAWAAVSTLQPEGVFWGLVSRPANDIASASEGRVFAMRYDTVQPIELARLTYSPLSITLDGSSLYLATQRQDTLPGTGAVIRVSTTGGPPSVLNVNQTPFALAIDPTHIYWADRTPIYTAPFAEIRRTPK